MSIKTHKQHFARTTLGHGRFVAWCGQTVPADRIIRRSEAASPGNVCRLCETTLRRHEQALGRARREAESAAAYELREAGHA